MGLTKWDSINDYFNHAELEENWDLVDAHDHSAGKGVQIGSGGIASAAIGSDHLQDTAITGTKLADNSISSDKLASNSVTSTKIQNGAVTSAKFAAHPAARAYNSAALSISNNAETALTFDSERFDTSNLHSVSTNTSRMTAPVNGIYVITANVSWAANATGIRRVFLRWNASSNIAYSQVSATSASVTAQNVATVYSLAASEYVEVFVLQTSGSALNIEASSQFSPEFTMTWVSNQ